jgi:DNA-directed RNA polymerase subunit E'/Rpb7
LPSNICLNPSWSTDEVSDAVAVCVELLQLKITNEEAINTVKVLIDLNVKFDVICFVFVEA